MKIVSISYEYQPHIIGGLGRFIEYYTKHGSEQGNDIFVVTFNKNNVSKRYEKSGGIDVYRPTSIIYRLFKKIFKSQLSIFEIINFFSFQFKAFTTVRRIHREQKIDIVSVHDWQTAIPGILCKLFIKVPLVFHVHSTELSMAKFWKTVYPSLFIGFIEKTAARLSDKIIVASEHMKQLLLKRRWSVKKIDIVYCGIDTNPDLCKLKGEYSSKKVFFENYFNDITESTRFIVFAGRYVKHKGLFLLLEAFSKVVKEDKNCKLIVLGQGDNDKVASLIKMYGLEKSVYASYAFVEAVVAHQFYFFADMCIFPSLYEPFGIVALESMLYGKPTVLGSGFSDIFFGTKEHPVAYKVDPVTPEQLKQSIVEVLTNADLRQAMSRNGRSFVNKFDQGELIKETLSLYADVAR